MGYEIEGAIKIINDTMTFDSGFRKREIVVITTGDQYPQDIKVDFIQDNVDLLDNFALGETVKVKFDLRGNEFKGKYYVNVQGTSIDSVVSNLIPDADDDNIPF